jgi:hypothetical protein
MSIKTTCVKCDMPRSVTDGGRFCKHCKWSWPHDPPACAACKKRFDVAANDPKSRAFLCHECLFKLDDQLRRQLLSTDDADSMHVKQAALTALGVDPRDVRIGLPRHTAPAERVCRCTKSAPIEQALLGGGVSVLCQRCGNAI